MDRSSSPLSRSLLPLTPLSPTAFSLPSPHHQLLRLELENAFRTRPVEDWEPLLDEAGLPYARVSSVPDLLQDEQLAHRKMVLPVDRDSFGGMAELLSLMRQKQQSSGQEPADEAHAAPAAQAAEQPSSEHYLTAGNPIKISGYPQLTRRPSFQPPPLWHPAPT